MLFRLGIIETEHFIQESPVTNDIVNRFGYKGSVSTPPFWIIFKNAFNYLIGIIIINKNVLKAKQDTIIERAIYFKRTDKNTIVVPKLIVIFEPQSEFYKKQ